MKPDVFQYRPSGETLPPWRKSIIIPGAFTREFTDPATEVVVNEFKKRTKNKRYYTRTESLPNNWTRDTSDKVTADYAAGVAYIDQSIEVDTRPSKIDPGERILYFPGNGSNSAISAYVFPGDGGNIVEFLAQYDHRGGLEKYLLSFGEEQFDQADVRDYKENLAEIASLTPLVGASPFLSDIHSDEEHKEINRILLKDAEVMVLAEPLIEECAMAFYNLPDEEQVRLTKQFVHEAVIGYLKKKAKAEKTHEEISDIAAQYMSYYFGISVTAALNHYRYTVASTMNYDAHITPSADAPGQFTLKITDPSEKETAYETTGFEDHPIRFEENIFTVSDSDNIKILRQQKLPLPNRSTPVNAFKFLKQIDMETVVPLITNPNYTLWQYTVPLVVPIFTKEDNKPTTAEVSSR